LGGCETRIHAATQRDWHQPVLFLFFPSVASLKLLDASKKTFRGLTCELQLGFSARQTRFASYSLVPSNADEDRHFSPGVFCNASVTMKQRSYFETPRRLKKYGCKSEF